MSNQKLVEVKVDLKDSFYMDQNGYQVLLDPDKLTAKFYRDFRSGYFTLSHLLTKISSSGLYYKLKSPEVQFSKTSKKVDTNSLKVDIIKYQLYFFPTILARIHLRR